MIVSVTNMNLRKQAYPTSCWISAAHFVLQYLGVDVTLSTLHAEFYAPDANSVFLMAGAGTAQRVLSKYAGAAGYSVHTLMTKTTPKPEIVRAIVDSIRHNIPVIASITSTKIKSFGHAIVVTAIDPETGTVAFKDPAAESSARAFRVDVRTLRYNEFVDGFSYRTMGRPPTQIKHNILFAFCHRITYLQPLRIGI